MASSEEGSPLSARSEVHPRECEETYGLECGEAYGPIMIRRYVKDDGRALALYSRGTSREAQRETTGEARA